MNALLGQVCAAYGALLLYLNRWQNATFAEDVTAHSGGDVLNRPQANSTLQVLCQVTNSRGRLVLRGNVGLVRALRTGIRSIRGWARFVRGLIVVNVYNGHWTLLRSRASAARAAVQLLLTTSRPITATESLFDVLSRFVCTLRNVVVVIVEGAQ